MNARILYQLIRHDWNDFRRNPALWIMVGIPVLLSFFVVKVMINETTGPAEAVPMWVLFAQAMIGIMTMTLNFVDEKEKKTLEALIITPATYRAVTLSKVLFVFVLVLLGQLGVLLINGGLIGNVFLLFLLMLVGGAVFVSIGLLISLFSETERNGSAVASALMVVLFLSGVVYEAFGSLTQVLRFLPGALTINLVRGAMHNQPVNVTDLSALLAWLLLFLLLAEWRIRAELLK
ncbi:MAG: hypothetical protein CVU38_17125 [Chloroflexi bacterium HGW-Chloroflexi-1]|nr:MAG: hypothetical protein CVU38_17125 [Chloroflexi bacterium HGW-Chloroflexi-1]